MTIRLHFYMADTIQTVSFATLSSPEQVGLTDFFDSIQAKKKSERLGALKEKFSGADAPMNTAKAIAIPALLRTDPQLFFSRQLAQRESLEQDLLLAYFKLCSDYQYHSNESRRQYLKGLAQDIERCEFLLQTLRVNEAERQLILEEHHKKLLKQEEDAFDLKRWLNKKAQLSLQILQDISAGKTVYLRQWMSDFNVWRLYWVWTGMGLGRAVEGLPTNFHHIQQTQAVLNAPKQALGYTSWLFYYVRFLINFILLLKHTIRGPWMSEEEKNKPLQTRLQQQWQQRKFMLLNDLLWATTNMICFFWLVGKGTLGYFGDLLTVGLLMADFLLSRSTVAEAHKKHLDEIKQFQNEIGLLNEKINTTQASTDLTPDEINYKTQLLEDQLQRLTAARDHYEFEWKHQKRQQKAGKIHAVSLICGYIIACAMLIPRGAISTASTAALGMVGAGILFLISVIYNVYRAHLEINKTQALRTSALQQCKAILSSNGSLSKADYVRFKTLEADALYQERMINYQENQLMRKFLIESLIPFVIFTAFTFLPFGWGIALAVVGVVLAVTSHHYLESKKPKPPSQVRLDNNAYETIDKKSALKSIESSLKGRSLRLFVPSKATPEEKPQASTAPTPDIPSV